MEKIVGMVVVTWRMEPGLIWKEYENTFWDNDNILYVDGI